MIRAMLHRPASLCVFLLSLDGFPLPLCRAFSSFDSRVFIARVPLLGHRGKRRINQLTATRLEAMLGQIDFNYRKKESPRPGPGRGFRETVR